VVSGAKIDDTGTVGPAGLIQAGEAGGPPDIRGGSREMNNNGSGFRSDEIVKIQNRDFVVIGGRLRVVHESYPKLSITTEVLDYVLDQHAVVRARVLTQAGEFTGTGVATAARDPKLADALIELAETRAVARALRFGGVGVECVGFEELGRGAILTNLRWWW
jgi:hypothetical protein